MSNLQPNKDGRFSDTTNDALAGKTMRKFRADISISYTVKLDDIAKSAITVQRVSPKIENGTDVCRWVPWQASPPS
jgi:hypothetical protein